MSFHVLGLLFAQSKYTLIGGSGKVNLSDKPLAIFWPSIRGYGQRVLQRSFSVTLPWLACCPLAPPRGTLRGLPSVASTPCKTGCNLGAWFGDKEAAPAPHHRGSALEPIRIYAPRRMVIGLVANALPLLCWLATSALMLVTLRG